jgi:murein L,D-transpeptidase YafK
MSPGGRLPGMKVRFILALAVSAAALAVGALAQERRASPLPGGTTADLIVVDKSDRVLTLFRGGRALKSYRIALGSDPIGPKQQEGDGRTPEGRYTIDARRRDSAFHRALHVSYPNALDRKAARRRGVSPGGDIMIHGLPNGMGGLGSLHRLRDSTRGCIAVTNEEIEEIWRAVPDGTPIEIRP